MTDQTETARDQTALRDRIAEVLVTTSREDWPYTPGQEKWDHHKHGDRPGHTYAISCALCTNDVDRLAAVLAAVLGANDLPATTCSAQYHGPGEEGARLCIRAAQHTGKAHTDEHGFHWSDTVAVYPLADGTFRTGVNVRAELRRLAEAQQDEAGARCTCGNAGVTLLPPGHYGDCPECPREARQEPTQDGEAKQPPMDPANILGIDGASAHCTGAEGFCAEHGFHRHATAGSGQPETDEEACAHGPDRHGPEAGCVECRCPSTTGHTATPPV